MILTSESVTEGHPDKICDQVSDALLDALLEQDPNSRVAIETLTKTGLILVAGEVTSSAHIDYQNIIRNTLKEIGYTDPRFGIDFEDCAVLQFIQQQSPDISQGVDHEGAGDQGMMYGYASNETKEYMPLPISLAHKLTKKLAEVRKKNIIPHLGPDGKSQVSVVYDKEGKPLRISTVVIAQQHTDEISEEELRKLIQKEVIEPITSEWTTEETKYHINSTGRFVIGGPEGDAGLTGRKIIVDTYGGVGRHGGGAFSGKDPTKVDRSAAYAARWVAKSVVAAGLANKCEVQLSYAIGVAQPTSIHIDTFGTGNKTDEEIANIVKKHFDLRPQKIIKELNLKKTEYKKTASYGHFGREEFSWEQVKKLN